MYYLYLIGNVLAFILPRNICYSLAKLSALIHFYLSKKDREVVLYNLEPVVDDKKNLRKYAKEVFINFSYYLVDFYRSARLNSEFIEKYVKISGLDNLNKCLSSEKGAIVLTAHLGNYELAGAVTALLGYPLSVVALPHNDKRINQFFDGRRQNFGMKVIPTGTALKGCLRALNQGDLLALLGDRDFSGSKLKLKMFGKEACFPRGAAFFALKTGACVIPAFLTRENKKFYHLRFEEPIDTHLKTKISQESLMKQYISVLEKYIKKYPQQWYLFEKYWL